MTDEKETPKFLQIVPTSDGFAITKDCDGLFAERVLSLALVEMADGSRQMDAILPHLECLHQTASMDPNFIGLAHQDDLDRILNEGIDTTIYRSKDNLPPMRQGFTP